MQEKIFRNILLNLLIKKVKLSILYLIINSTFDYPINKILSNK